MNRQISRRISRRISLAIAALSIGAATALAAPTHADDTDTNADTNTDADTDANTDANSDTAFLNAAHERGITMEHGDQELIGFAHNVCRLLADGYSMNALVESDELHETNGISNDDVQFMVAAAAASYCPEYAVP
ncbi:hypothetical protein A5672_18030 [Mycobacterium alsense]|uniref:DUF732 domain-containing protein n=1 Tax=Mycobacterium alsense TaxID=324058 RepID=A0ABD6P3N9_9MYCO|nr:DUF732 domain-containing protein [Mycobacterium alsense]OBG37545.1 hypothetical protein A5672_18030 [Mycobacterium alsense]